MWSAILFLTAGDSDRRAESFSRRVTEQREILYHEIQDKALAWSIGRAEVEDIDRINILQASLLAMERAIKALSCKPHHVQVDGIHCPKIACSAEAIIKGDQKVPAISAASIIAKVTRDREMIEMEKHYPGYGFAQHKGYGTVLHLKALERLGPCAIHRQSFRPVRELKSIF